MNNKKIEDSEKIHRRCIFSKFSIISKLIIILMVGISLIYTLVLASAVLAQKSTDNTNQSAAEEEKITVEFLSEQNYVQSDKIDIKGNVTANSEVALYVNDLDIPHRTLLSQDTSDGRYIFTGIPLPKGSNQIKITGKFPSGNTKTLGPYNVIVDRKKPEIEIEQTPEFTKERQIAVKGKVDEKVTIKAIIEYKPLTVTPPKISGIKTIANEPNKVEIAWDPVRIEEFARADDFRHYAVYRADVGVIELISKIDQTSFTDTKVKSSSTYIYQVSAVDKFGNEGPKSDPLKVITPQGPVTQTEAPKKKDIGEGTTTVKDELDFADLEGNFQFAIPLNKGDGRYMITLQAKDLAGNIDDLGREIILDTKKPEINVLSPSHGSTIFENVANNIRVRGKTEPNAEVMLVVMAMPIDVSPATEVQLDVSGLPDEIQDIAKSRLQAQCRTPTCKPKFMKTTSDEFGNFEFGNVDLTPSLFIGGSAREISPTQFNQPQVRATTRKSAALLLIAKDNVGLNGTSLVSINIGSCFEGEFAWSINPLTEFQSPFTLSPERIAEGSEAIYFYLKYEHLRQNIQNANILDISLTPACSTDIKNMDERYVKACSLLGSIRGYNPSRLLSKDTSYHAVKLSPIGLEEKTAKEVKDYINGLGNEIAFPFRVSVRYTENGQSKTQVSCQEVSYIIDDTLVDFSRLPDILLVDFVDFLDFSSEKLQTANNQVKRAAKIAAVGCVGSYTGRFFIQSIRKIVEGIEELKLKLEKANILAKLSLPLASADPEEMHCLKLKSKLIKLDDVSDQDLKKCFPNVAKWWDREAGAYQAFRFSCDRLIGKPAPAGWTKELDDDKLQDALKMNLACPGDLYMKGLRPPMARKCYGNYAAYEHEITDPDLMCLEVPLEGGDKALYSINPKPVSEKNNLYELQLLINGRILGSDYGIKVDNKNYLLPQPKTCQEVCTGTVATTQNTEIKTNEDGSVEIIDKTKKDEKKVLTQKCMKINQCLDLKKDAAKRPLKFESKTYDPGKYSVSLEGYTEDCFYDPDSRDTRLKDKEVVSPDPNVGLGCCCVLGEEADKPAEQKFFAPMDKDRINKQPIHEFKSDASQPYGVGDMKFSYRYYEQGFKVDGVDEPKEYNPYRYITGRDFPACFGQNNLFLELLGREKEAITVDPFTQHEAAFQCAALSQIGNRLQLMSNMMQSTSNCLKQVRETGTVDTGVCKELFTQHLCGLLWQAVKTFTTNKCSAYDSSLPDPNKGTGELEKKSIGFKDYFGIGTGAIEDALAQNQESFSREYGNSQLNQFFGTGTGSVARKVCLGAFGYDWDYKLGSIVDLAYTSPSATLPQAVGARREYITADPLTGYATYEYRTGYFINPGCDFDRYDIYLSCASQREQQLYPNQIDCSKQNDPLGSNCDCLRLENEKTEILLPGRRLQQNVPEDQNTRKVVSSLYRYDHLKFVLHPDARIDPRLRDKCFPDGYSDGVFYYPIRDITGRDLVDWYVDVETGTFNWKSPFTLSQFGTARIEKVELFINGKPVRPGQPQVSSADLFLEQKLEIQPTIINQGKPKCLKVSVTPSAHPEFVYIFSGGTYQNKLDLTKYMQFTGFEKDIVLPDDVTAVPIERLNTKQVIFDIDYKATDEGVMDLNPASDDEISIAGITTGLVKISELARESGATVEGNGITIEKEGAKIRITRLVVQRNIEGKPIEPSKVRIIVNPRSDAEIKSEVKTINIEVFNPKQDTELLSANDCDFNNPARFPAEVGGQPQKMSIAINLKKEATPLVKGITIRELKIVPNTAAPSENIEISATVTDAHELGYGEPDVSMEITTPAGKKKEIPSGLTSFSNNRFQANFDRQTLGLQEAGTYNFKITAKSKNAAVAEETVAGSFEFLCSPNAKCQTTCDSDQMSSPAFTCTTGMQCCKIG